MKKIYIIMLFFLFLSQSCQSLICCDEAKRYEINSNPEIVFIKKDGYRVDWSHFHDLILYDKKQDDGYYDVYLMNNDGTGEKCLTDKSFLPEGHKGCSVWHPSGEYIVYTSQKDSYFGKKIPILSKWLDNLGTPGQGVNCDLWAMTKDGEKFWQLTDIPTKTRFLDKQPYTAILHPHFSNDGTKLFWTERVDNGDKWGVWTINIGDFITEDDNLKIDNIVIYQPGEHLCFYESHGFSPDDSKIIFSGNLELGQDVNHLDIYTLDLENFNIERLTETNDQWDEHAHYSPNSDKIVWMSSNGYGMSTVRNWWDELKTDYWIMNYDGTGKTKLTFYNENANDDRRVICSDCSWNNDGTKLAITVLMVEGEHTEGGIAILDI